MKTLSTVLFALLISFMALAQTAEEVQEAVSDFDPQIGIEYIYTECTGGGCCITVHWHISNTTNLVIDSIERTYDCMMDVGDGDYMFIQ